MRRLIFVLVLLVNAPIARASDGRDVFATTQTPVIPEVNVQNNDSFDHGDRSKVREFVDNFLSDQKSLSSQKPQNSPSKRSK